MFDQEKALELIRTGEPLVMIEHTYDFWKPFKSTQLVEAEAAPCGHIDCPPIDFKPVTSGWTKKGVMKKTYQILREEKKFRDQKAISEALGG